MKKTTFTISMLLCLVAMCFTSCKTNEPDAFDQRWITSYQNVTIGSHNFAGGNFLYLKTGKTVKLNAVTAENQKNLALFYPATNINGYICFPANADDPFDGAGGTPNTSLFTQNPQGVNHWNASGKTGGKIQITKTLTIQEFADLASLRDPKNFDALYRANNNNTGKEFISGLTYTLNPKSGQTYLLDFNGLIRAIMWVKNASIGAGGSITFDLIVESRESYNRFDQTKHLQPDDPEK
ncbi:MAG: hypothetical protein GX102_11215 [Porphyromonadaceae bacterium]|jgi:hypothetical protein|nr:hypothetical protein [Porphyromonadaceae bacterium]